MSSPRDPKVFVRDAKDAADAIAHFTQGVDWAQYATDDLVRSAVERKFEIVGEALNQLAKAAPGLASHVSRLRDIVDFRNLLAHGYDKVDHALVWGYVSDTLPVLRREIDALARDLAA